MHVVDLGAAPGGWSQVAAKAVGSTAENPLVVGIDYLEMDPIPGVILLQKDFTEDDAPDLLFAAMGGHKADVVMSDMAWPTTGHRPTDHLRIVHLIEIAADFAIQVLNPGGAFVAKVFQGGTEHELLHMLKRHFKTTLHVKPPSSRSESAEAYLVAKGFKGKVEAEESDDE
jgi:23S rRNA (uridine2552-2'-O)-methyltransferase